MKARELAKQKNFILLHSDSGYAILLKSGAIMHPATWRQQMTKVSYERNGKEYSLDTATLPEAAIAYLLQYGFSQSLQDSIAGRAKAVRDEMTEDGKSPAESVILSAIEQDLDGQLQKRAKAIAEGTVAVRGPGVAKDPAAGIVRELLLAWAKSKGGKLPKADSDEYKALAAKMREVKKDFIAAELERRAAVSAEIDIDLS